MGNKINYSRIDVLSALMSKTWEQNIAEFKILGVSWIDQYGSVKNVGTGDSQISMWEGKTKYVYTVDSGAEYYVSSSSAADNQNVNFSVLTVDTDGNWNNEEFIQQINGQTKTLLTPPSGNPCVRIQRIENEADSGGDIAGMVYVYENDTVVAGVPQTSSKIKGFMGSGNQSKMCIYTIPSGKVGFLYRGEAGINKSGGVTAEAEVGYKSRRFGKIFKIKKDFSVMTGGTSIYKDKRTIPDILPAKTDLELFISSVSATVGMFGTFDIILLDELLLPESYLNAIGQIKKI